MEKASRGNQEKLESCESGLLIFCLVVIDTRILKAYFCTLSLMQVVDARGGPSLKITSRPKKIKSMNKKARPSPISRLQKELKRNSEFCLLLLYDAAVCLPVFHCSANLCRRDFFSCFALLTRFRCPQHNLQCLSCSVSKLQQPVR